MIEIMIEIELDTILTDRKEGNCPFCHDKCSYVSMGLTCDEHGVITSESYFKAIEDVVKLSLEEDVDEDCTYTGQIIDEEMDVTNNVTILKVEVGDMVGWPRGIIRFWLTENDALV